jgi:hypothetical protein
MLLLPKSVDKLAAFPYAVRLSRSDLDKAGISVFVYATKSSMSFAKLCNIGFRAKVLASLGFLGILSSSSVRWVTALPRFVIY